MHSTSWVWLCFRPAAAPALPPEERAASGADLARRVVFSLLPPLLLILVVLGSIFAGVATPTEAGALGAVGAMGMAAVGRGLTMGALRAAMMETSRLTVMVIFLLIGSTAFALVFRGLDGDLWIADLLTGLPGGPLGFLLVVNLVVFLLGFFIDFFEIAFIVVPLIVLPARQLGIDLAWLGILIAVNLQTSFLTPPFGFSLFYLRGVMPKRISTTTLYLGVVPFIVIQVLVLLALILFTAPNVGFSPGAKVSPARVERAEELWPEACERLLGDPAFGPLVERVGPVRIQDTGTDSFSFLVRSVTYQQLAGKAAAAIHGRLVAALGGTVSPAVVLESSEDTLGAVGLSRAKQASIRDLAAKVADGTVPLDDLGSLTDEAVIERLVEVRGIGTLDCGDGTALPPPARRRLASRRPRSAVGPRPHLRPGRAPGAARGGTDRVGFTAHGEAPLPGTAGAR